MRSFQSFFQNLYPESFITDSKTRISYPELFSNAKLLAKGFMQHGAVVQSKVALISQHCIEWVMCDIACLYAGIITVPLFSNSSNETLDYQISNCEPDFLIVENEEVLEKVQNSTNFKFKGIFLINGRKFSKNITLEDLIFEAKLGKDVILPAEINQSATATIVYTSGTSGNPKGVVLTYSNFAHQVDDIQTCYPEITKQDTAISILPAAHVYQRSITYFYLSRGVSIHIINDVASVVKHIARIKPSLITVVPRVLEKVYGAVKSKVEAMPKFVGKPMMALFKFASSNVIKNKALLFFCDIIFFRKVRTIFGRNIKFIVSGGAKLNSDEETFFFNARIPVFQGYGMTECSPVIAANTRKERKLYTVGKPLSSVEVKIAKDGEICIRGRSLFSCYYGEEKRNQMQFFPTGDSGKLDGEGYLTVSGRIREQFKTANGKFVNPVKIEALLNVIGGVEGSCIIAENKPFVTAIIFSKTADQTRINNEISKINDHLDHHERIQYFYIINENPTVESNIITPSLKLRRNYIAEKFAMQIKEMYKNR